MENLLRNINEIYLYWPPILSVFKYVNFLLISIFVELSKFDNCIHFPALKSGVLLKFGNGLFWQRSIRFISVLYVLAGIKQATFLGMLPLQLNIVDEE